MGASASTQKRSKTKAAEIPAKAQTDMKTSSLFLSAEDLFDSLTNLKKHDHTQHIDKNDDDDDDDDDTDNEWGELDEHEELFFSQVTQPRAAATATTAATTTAAVDNAVSAVSAAAGGGAAPKRSESGAFSVTLHEVALFQLQVLGSVADVIGFSLENTWLLLEHVGWDRDLLIEKLFSSAEPDASSTLAVEAGVWLAGEPQPQRAANAQLLQFETVLGSPDGLTDGAVPAPHAAPPQPAPYVHSSEHLMTHYGIVFGHRLATELLQVVPKARILDLLKQKRFAEIPDIVLNQVGTNDELFTDSVDGSRVSLWIDALKIRQAVAEAEATEEKQIKAAIERAAAHIDIVHKPRPPTPPPPPPTTDDLTSSVQQLLLQVFQDEADSEDAEVRRAIAAVAAATAGIARSDNAYDNDDDDDDAAAAAQRKAKLTASSKSTQVSMAVQSATVIHAGTFDDDVVAAPAAAAVAAAAPEPDVECSICYTDVPHGDSHALACGHRFCKDCWGSHLSAALSSGKVLARCMHAGCKVALSPLAWHALLNRALFARYRRLSLQQFVDRSPVSAFCTNPKGCSRVIFWPRVLQATSTALVECLCGHRLCWGCLEQPHAPASCAQVKEFLTASGTAADELWIARNTKPCPRCKVAIEKNEGCLHMTCGGNMGSGCGYEFCWLCLESWAGHSGYYQCSRPVANVLGHENKVAATVQRYDFHQKAVRAVQQRALICEIVAFRLQRETLPGARIMEAHALVIDCHRLLAWCEVFSLSVEFEVHASLLAELLHNLRIHVDRIWEKVLSITNGDDRHKPLQVRATALNALHAMSSVVERHRAALCEALDGGVAFESAGGASLSSKARKVDKDGSGEKASIPSASVPARIAQRVMHTRPMLVLRQLQRNGGAASAQTDIFRVDPLYGDVEIQQQRFRGSNDYYD